jgi:hypothetical protein
MDCPEVAAMPFSVQIGGPTLRPSTRYLPSLARVPLGGSASGIRSVDFATRLGCLVTKDI